MTDYKGQKVLIHLDDDVPKIGSGLRLVYVRHVGRKWVHLVGLPGAEAAHIRRQKWDKLVRYVRDVIE